MKHLNLISKIVLTVVATVGLAIGMSSVSGLSDNANITISSDNSIMESNCGSGKCGGGDGKETNVNKKCGGDNAAAKKSNLMDMDVNGDGKVSKTEFTDHGTNEFPNRDSNSDGKLTSDECSMFDSFNADENDYVSKTEFENGHNNMFSKMDINNDGFIDSKEVKSMHVSDNAKCGEGKCGEGKCG